MARNTGRSGMYIRFDPNKILLPPIFGGPSPHILPTSGVSYAIGSKRKRDQEGSTSSPPFSNFEKVLQRATENEVTYAAPEEASGSSWKRAKGTYHEPVKKDHLRTFESRNDLMTALRDAFKAGPDVDFAGTYRTHDPGVTHRQRIQTITHEIWKSTGYRFTVKDHPRTKSGHKTRLWCSQDVSHRSKSSRASQKPRTSSDGVVLAKTRYPCRSGLLVSSREESEPDTVFVIVRMHHHVAHEPYYDNTLPPEMTQSIWESMGWGQSSNLAPAASEISDTGSEDEVGELAYRHTEPTSDGNLPPPPPPPLPVTPEVYHQRMRHHIDTIRDFCDGLEYQLPFNDFRMLEVLETEGAQFLGLVHNCLQLEGRLKTSSEEKSENAATGNTDASATNTT